jgi:OOP family OmpA-OmpF porin
MRAPTAVLSLAAALFATLPGGSAAQQASLLSGSYRQGAWGGTALGLSVQRNDLRLPCSTGPGSCEELSLVGRASFGATPFGLYGKLGTTYPRNFMPGTDSAAGLSYGAGVSWDFSPRASATLGWDSYDLRLGGSPVRATSLGLQWRY